MCFNVPMTTDGGFFWSTDSTAQNLLKIVLKPLGLFSPIPNLSPLQLPFAV